MSVDDKMSLSEYCAKKAEPAVKVFIEKHFPEYESCSETFDFLQLFNLEKREVQQLIENKMIGVVEALKLSPFERFNL